MPADPLSQLSDALKSAQQAGTPVPLASDFMLKSGATPPSDLDALLRKAFRLNATQALQIKLGSADIGPVVDDKLKVTGAQVSFLGRDAAKSSVTLVFTRGTTAVDVLVAVELTGGWMFSDTFTAMIDPPFTLFPCTDTTHPTFAFTTLAGPYAWQPGVDVQLNRGQNFVGRFADPAELGPYLALLTLQGEQSVVLGGPIEVDRVTEVEGLPETEPVVLYPDMDLTAVRTEQSVKLFGGLVQAKSPGLRLLVTTAPGEPTEDLDQSAELFVTLEIDVKGTPYELRVPVSTWGKTFTLDLVSPEGKPLLSLRDAVAILGSSTGQNPLPKVPSALQGALASVGLQGLTLRGSLPPPPGSLAWAKLALGSNGKVPLFTDPFNGQAFALDGFAVDWTVLDPLNAKNRSSLVSVSARFKLWPSVFKGEFLVSVDQNLSLQGQFLGSVTLADIITGVTNGAVQPPDGVKVEVSDIRLSVDTPSKSYALSGVVDADVSFITVGGKPLITVENMHVLLGAVTPSKDAKTTAYRAELNGYLAVGPLAANVDVRYRSAEKSSLWELHAALARPVQLGDLVGQFFRAYDLPSDLLPKDLAISKLAVDATIPSAPKGKIARYVNGYWVVPSDAELLAEASTAHRSYKVSGELDWTISWLHDAKAKAAVGLQYSDDPSAGFSGQVVGDLYFGDAPRAIHLTAGYRFGTTTQDLLFAGAVPLPAGTDGNADSKVLWIQWEGVTGQYDSTTKKLTLSLAGWTVGGLVQALVHTLGDPYFTLDAPWDVLNKISLDGLKLVFDLGSKSKPTIEADYTLSSPIDLVFLKITGLTFRRNDQGKVTLQITGSTTLGDIKDSGLMKPGGQDVTNLPAAPGQGTQWFDLRLLMLGQRVGVNSGTFDNVEKALASLEKIQGTEGDKNPVNPDDTTRGKVRYDSGSNWLIAAHFLLLKGTVDAKIVFNDPNLYGLRLALSGEKAKVLDGLVLDIMYKKVTDDVGVYGLDFTFPSSLRNLDFGAFSVTLPSIGVRIYTNGDFLVDFGFPYQMDFSRSFTVQAIIAGVPVIGSAGFYFGRLSVGAKSQLPANASGTFGTATTFGIGLQLGIGKTIEKGPLRAGFSVTAFGIVEGIFASWEPEKSLAVRSSSDAALQADYFFRLRGTFGLAGQLYGSVDFGVIRGSVDVSVKLSASIVYEAYADIQLSASASVRVAVSLTVNLGLFSFDLHFSFAATVSADMTLHTSDHNPPWGSRAVNRPRAVALPAVTTAPVWKTVKRTGTKPAFTLYPTPQYTVHAPKAGAKASEQQGAFVLLLATDAPTATGDGNASGSSFQSLCEALLPWVVDAYTNPSGTEVDLEAVLKQSVSGTQLQALVEAFGSGKASFTEADVERKLLDAGFTVTVTPATKDGPLKNGATTFPAFAGLTVTFPAATGTGTVALDRYTTVDAAYRARLDEWFAQLAAQVEQEQKSPAAKDLKDGADTRPLAQYLFEDWFRLVIRQLFQAGADSFGDYRYPLAAEKDNGLKAVLDWAHGRGNDHLSALDVALPNLDVPLTAGKKLRVSGLAYTVQNGDSLSAVAARYSDAGSPPRWTCDAGELLRTNADRHGLVAAGAVVSSSGKGPYTTQPGDSFASVAEKLGLTVDQLAGDKALLGRPDLLSPAVPVAVPAITYTTATGDTLRSVTQRFAVPLATLIEDPDNQAVTGLFAAQALHLPDLEKLLLSDVLAALTADRQIAHTAGMTARYSLHGMRLPKLAGLTLPKGFLYPADQDDYGLYQLTGQQFPVPETIPAAYAITLGKGPDLSWLTVPGSAIDLSEPARRLGHVRGWARKNGYDPRPTIELQPAAVAEGKRYAAQSATPWSTSDQAALTALTSPPATVLAAGAAPQPQPLLWNLPPSLLRHVEQRETALAARFTPAKALPYLPLFTPETATADPTTAQVVPVPVTDYVYATRVQFQVKKLAQTDGGAPQTPEANSVLPPDSGNKGGPAPLAPFTYQVTGPSPADAALLERLLTSLGQGTDLISGLFLLLPDSGRSRTGLTSRGTNELLAFLTRTNLTTETAPPTLRDATTGEGPARGIVTPPAEFVRLLWELSTVRTGGYYLYYQVPKEGTGLPDSVFDSSGTATLTLVVTYHRRTGGEPGAGRLTGYVNSLLTTGALDPEHATLTFASQSSPAPGAPLDGHETLDDLAALYGTDPGMLARLNAGVALPAGLKLPVPDGLHQVDAKDVATGDALAAVAAHWSEHAAQPVTREQLAAYNPGVTPALGTALRVPPITRVTVSGDTLNGLVDHYGSSPEELGRAARDVPGIFPATTRPLTDSEEPAVSPVLGSGNSGVRLTRPTPAAPGDLPQNPTDAQVKQFSTATLGQLFSLLSPGVEGSTFFDRSPQGLPAGPVDAGEAPGAASVRRPETARALLRELKTAPEQHYRQTVGFRAYAKVNPAPDVTADGLPPRKDNPYAGVGTPVQLRLRWHDVFGNLAVTPFDAPPSGYTGALDRRPDPLHYEDRVIGLAQWPNVRSGYTYQGAAGSPALTVGLRLMTDAYEQPSTDTDPRARILTTGLPDWQQRAVNDLRTFTTVYYQLNQDYTSAGVPGLSGNAMALSWANSLLKAPEQPLTADQATALRSFVADCVKYLHKRAAGQPGGTAPSVQLTTPVVLKDVTEDDIVPLTLALTLTRRDDLVDPALRSTPVHADTTLIMPAAEDGTEVSLKSFAETMQTAFRTPDWQFRVGTSAAATGQGADDGPTLWVVRMAFTPGKGLGYTIGADPGFYAPKPLATALRDGTATIGRYTTGQAFAPASQALAFTGVDLNVWARRALTAIDAFLSPTFTSPARIVDQLTATDPETNGALPLILEQKKRLAAAIAATVAPVLKDSPADGLTLKAAADKMEQALLDHLGAASTVSAVTVLPVTGARGTVDATAPRFYGQVQRDPSQEDSGAVQDFSLSTAKIALTPEGGSGDSRLAFLFESRNAADQTHVRLGVRYAVTHLEHDIRSVPGIEDYRSSRWITWVTGPLTSELGTIDFPVVLRELPQPPSVTDQSALPTHRDAQGFPAAGAGLTPRELTEWDYSFDYRYDSAAQDRVHAHVVFNTGRRARALRSAAEAALFTALAQFTTVHPAVAADLETHLRPVGADAKATDTAVVNGGFALAALVAITTDLATAYENWAKPSVAADTTTTGPKPIEYDVQFGLSDDGGAARVDVYCEPTVPEPQVLIPRSDSTPVRVTPPPGARYAWEFTGKGGAKVPFAGAPAERTVGFPELGVFGHQDGQASVKVVRNEALVPGKETAGGFVFTTPTVAFADPVVPLIAHDTYDLGSLTVTDTTVKGYLTEFVRQLLADSGNLPVAVKLSSAYAYRLRKDVKDLPLTVLPISLLPLTATSASEAGTWIAQVAGSVEAFRTAYQPVSDESARVTFRLEVFAAGEGQHSLPLLTVRDLFVMVGRLKQT